MRPTLGKVTQATYFGLLVEVICRMENCSMIRFRGKSFIVETADLIATNMSKNAA